MKNKPALRDNLFYMAHACKFIGISRRTMHNWLNEKKISSIKNISNQHLFELRDINKLREARGMTVLSEEEAKRIWRDGE